MSRTTILHVEDDANDVVLFQHACERAGLACEVRAVNDGHEAMVYLTGPEQPNGSARPLPELLLLDLKMPRVNGFEFLAWLRAEEKFRRMPVVVLSSSSQEADVQRAYDAGANSYLVKPVDFNRLVEIAKAIGHYWLTLNETPQAAH